MTWTVRLSCVRFKTPGEGMPLGALTDAAVFAVVLPVEPWIPSEGSGTTMDIWPARFMIVTLDQAPVLERVIPTESKEPRHLGGHSY